MTKIAPLCDDYSQDIYLMQTCRYFIENIEYNPDLTKEQNDAFRQKEQG